MQSYFDEGNCHFTKWVDPPHYEHTNEYIQYLKNKIFDLQQRVETLEADLAANPYAVINAEGDPICPNPWCKCPYHHNNNRPPSSPSFGATSQFSQNY